jgi:hypothetical protein
MSSAFRWAYPPSVAPGCEWRADLACCMVDIWLYGLTLR